jgi:protein involved in polysaccharide export with SLBB domain
MIRSRWALLALMFASSAFAENPCRMLDDQSVHLLGAVQTPTSVPGNTGLLQGLALAGGLRDDAYAAGAVLLRPLDAGTAHATSSTAQTAAAAWQIRSGSAANDQEIPSLADILLGTGRYTRVPVLADPARLRANPHLNPVLLPGDVLIYPSRPTFIAVVGNVNLPGLYAYEPGQSAADYIRAAQGFSARAHRSATYAIGPDGANRELRVEYWNHRHDTLMPGSVIHVPARKDDQGLAAALTSQLNLHADGACAR